MQWSIWLPLVIGPCVIILGTGLTAFMPETMHLRKHVNTPTDTVTPINSSGDSSHDNSVLATFTRHLRSAIAGLKHSTNLIRSAPLLLLLSTFLVHYLIQNVDDISLQYISKRFSWPLYRTGFVLSLRAAVNVLLLSLILPGISQLLISPPSLLTRTLRMHSHSGPEKDLLLARVSVILLIGGAAVLALSPTVSLTIMGLIVLTLGSGFNALCRSLITPLVDAEHMGRLYAIISVVDTIGAFAAQPVLAGLLTLGIKWGGGWLGLPYAGMGVLCLLTGVAVFCVRMPEAKNAGADGEETRGEERRDEEAGVVGKVAGESVLAISAVDEMGVRAEGPVADAGQGVIC